MKLVSAGYSFATCMTDRIKSSGMEGKNSSCCSPDASTSALKTAVIPKHTCVAGSPRMRLPFPRGEISGGGGRGKAGEGGETHTHSAWAQHQTALPPLTARVAQRVCFPPGVPARAHRQ